MTALFSQIPEPLAYAEQLCMHYASLCAATDAEALDHRMAQAAATLTGCELTMLFGQDPAAGELCLLAQLAPGRSQRGKPRNSGHYDRCQLLRSSLDDNRTVSVTDGNGELYDTTFLPAGPHAWRSILCQPLVDPDGRVAGLVLCATSRGRALDMFAPSLAALGAFALSRRRVSTSLRSSSPSARTAGRERGDLGLVGTSAAMAHVRRLIGKVLDTHHTVLLTGETGTGKEVVSRAIHQQGSRRSGPFVVQNCAAFAESLLESELFGYRKGAFTGADHDRAGLFEAADGGTLVLDEIGDMPLSLQAKLLRVLQEGEVRPLGASVTRKVDVRIIAATHRDLQAMIAEGRFRADLYYRLAHFPIELPALRERGEDIMALARQFAAEACAAGNRTPLRWTRDTENALLRYSFPGNVRELKGMVERAVLMCEGEHLSPEDFSLSATATDHAGGSSFRERMDAFERDMLLQSLRNAGGNRSLAARQLGVARRTLLYRMAHLNIAPRFAEGR